jgi:CheY-like chemotaxis protein
MHPPAPVRVLVVDDSTDNAETIATLVRLWGHQPRVACDGPAALAAARDFRPDVVLLDIAMPGMDGYEVARRLRGEAETASAVLVALTGYGQEQDRRRARAAGFDLFLLKPCDPESLRRLLEGVPTGGSPDRGPLVAEAECGC